MPTKTEVQALLDKANESLLNLARLSLGEGDQPEPTVPEDGDWSYVAKAFQEKIANLSDEATVARAAKVSQADDLRRAREACQQLEAELAAKAAPKVAPVEPPQPTVGQMPPERLIQELTNVKAQLATARTERDSYCQQLVAKG